jgi:hypothetical protein
MRPALKWAFLASAGMSALALLPRQDGNPPVVGFVDSGARPDGGAPKPDLATLAKQRGSTGPRSLVTQLMPIAIEVPKRDIFAPVEPPAPPPPKIQAAAPQAPPTAPPAPTAPAFSYRFFGRMQTPEGSQLVMLVRGEAVVQLEPGMVLDDGYRVEAILDDRVRLSFAQFGVTIELPIPPAATQ